MRKIFKDVFRGSLITFIGRIINAGCQYGLILVMGRCLGAAGVGLFFLGKAIMMFSNALSSIGLNASLPKFIPEYIVKDEYGKVLECIKFSFLIVLIFSVAISVGLFKSADYLALNVFNDVHLAGVIRLFCIVLPIYALLRMLLSSIRSFRDMVGLTIVESIILPLGTIIFGLFFLAYRSSVFSIVWAFLVSVVLGIAVSAYLLFKKFENKKNRLTKRHISYGYILKYSFPLMGTGIIGFALSWVDTFMIGLFRNSGEIGIYNGASRIALFSNIILASVNTIFGPTISTLYSKGLMKDLELSYKATVRWIIYISIPVYLMIFLFPQGIMSFYGTEFIAGSTALVILAIGQLVNISVGSAGYLLTMTGRPTVEFINTIASLLIDILLNFYLIPLYGINGAAIATAVSLSAINILRVLENYHFLNIHPFSLKILWPLELRKGLQ